MQSQFQSQIVKSQSRSQTEGNADQISLLKDGDFSPHTWAELKQLIANNDLAELKRKPSEVIKYRQWRDKIKMAYCSINDYVCQERLQWEPLPTNTPDEQPMFECKSSTLFANPEDFKILRNDWPYGMTPDITHLVVWLKNRIPLDSTTGDLTYQSRQEINGFVQNIFIRRIGGSDAADRVLWFKNWSSIQSVKGIDHMHVLVRNVSDILLEEWTH